MAAGSVIALIHHHNSQRLKTWHADYASRPIASTAPEITSVLPVAGLENQTEEDSPPTQSANSPTL